MKESDKELDNNILLKKAIQNKDVNSISDLVKKLGKDIDKDLIFEAVNTDNIGIINYIAMNILVNKRIPFSQLYAIDPNPVEYVTNRYLMMQNHFIDDLPLQQYILDNCNKTLEVMNECLSSVNANTVSSAIQNNCDQSIIDNLLEFKDIELNKTTGYFPPPLNACLWSNKLELFKKFIEKGADVNFTLSGQNHIIFDALRPDKESFLDILIKHKVDLNVVSIYQKDQTPLLKVLGQSEFDMAEKLIQNGAKIDLDKMKQLDFLSDKKVEFILRHDLKTQELLRKVSSENAYEKFEEAKKENNIFLVKVLLKEYSSSIFPQISKEATHKENIFFFQKNNISIKFKHNDLIVGSQVNITNETIGGHDNPKDIKQNSKTYIKDNKIFDEVTKSKINFSENTNKIYVMDKKGVLYIQNDSYTGLHHSFFLKGKPEKYGQKNELYGYGKPIACGGHIEIKEGKITYIDNGSGHYQPNIDQLKMAVNYLNKQGVLSENVVIKEHVQGAEYDLKTFLSGELEIKVPELYGNKKLKKEEKIEHKIDVKELSKSVKIDSKHTAQPNNTNNEKTYVEKLEHQRSNKQKSVKIDFN